MNGGVLLAPLVTLIVGGSVAFALRLPGSLEAMPGWLESWPAWALLLVPYLPLSALAIARSWRREDLPALVRFRPGDLSLGIGLSLLLVGAAWVLSRVAWPPGSDAQAWVFQILMLARDTSGLAAIGALVLLAASEELVWRGLVQSELGAALGARRGWLTAAVLYALAHVPTLFTLRDPVVGANPLIVLAALGTGLCWGLLRELTGRVVPAFLSHAALYYLATQYLAPLL